MMKVAWMDCVSIVDGVRARRACLLPTISPTDKITRTRKALLSQTTCSFQPN